MPDDEVCYLLASCAVEISKVILEICQSPGTLHSSHRRRIAGEIATMLHLIHTYLKSLPPYLVDPDIEQLSRNLLQSLAEICVWPQRFKVLQATLIPQCYTCIVNLLAPNNKLALKQSLTEFFNATKNGSRLEEFNGCCREFYKKLIPDDVDDAEGLPDTVRHLDQDDISTHFNDDFFNTLQLHSKCNPGSHGKLAGDSTCQDPRHPARLCLMNDAVSLDVLIATRDMGFWQEIRLTRQAESQPSTESQLIAQGGFCELLEMQLAARIVLLFQPRNGFYNLNETQILDQDFLPGQGESLSSVLRSYQLTPKDKVTLSYAMARAYWQFYDSDLVRTKWTSETIWFMPEDSHSGSKDRLPLRSYLTFPSSAPSIPLQDILHETLVNHQCPRIFVIGKLLLEIGLSEPFPAGIRKNQVAQVNLDHKIATSQLKRLQSMDWDGFHNKKYFDKAVAYCLDSDNFIQRSNQSEIIRPSTTNPVSANLENETEIRTRRKKFYKNVVQPLAWLAKRGFGGPTQQVTYINRKGNSLPTGEPAILHLQPETRLHSGTDAARKWLQDLNTISADVQLLRRRHHINIPIRVAILDTGFDFTLSEFEKDNNKHNCITHMRDFVDLNCQPTMTDTYGHGTFMTKLIMECAPLAEIIVARVAKNAKELNQSQNNIAKAICWATMECEANVVSMSFGFPADHEGISNAIYAVQAERHGSVIFLSSAGNSPTEDESFPARHPSVISVYATNCYGSFAESNAIEDSNGPAILGTFSDPIPNDICNEFKTKFPNVCQPGSSVATAVAAGISATMLAYTTVLPSLFKISCIPEGVLKRRLQRLWESKGMEALFYKMALEKHRHRWWVSPIWFWKEKQSDFLRCVAIYDCMSKFEAKHPLPPC